MGEVNRGAYLGARRETWQGLEVHCRGATRGGVVLLVVTWWWVSWASLQKSFNNMHKLDEDGTETSVGGGGEFDICKGSC